MGGSEQPAAKGEFVFWAETVTKSQSFLVFSKKCIEEPTWRGFSSRTVEADHREERGLREGAARPPGAGTRLLERRVSHASR